MTNWMIFDKFDWNNSINEQDLSITLVRSDLPKKRRVLIASGHALFAQGLSSLLRERQAQGVEVAGVVTNLEEAMLALEKLAPDLVIVDYDDETLNRDEFLARFVEGEKKLRVVLLSLQGTSEAVVYDRRTLAAAQIDDWLKEWTYSDDIAKDLMVDEPVKRKANHRRVNMKNRAKNIMHFVVVSILVVIMTVALLFALQNIRLLPVAASAQATPIDTLFRGESVVIAFLFSLIVVFMLYSIFVFRRKKGDTTDAAHIEGNTKLEITWTILPLITVMVFAVWGGRSLSETLRQEAKPLIVRVVGQQWSWRFEYPQLDGSTVISDVMYMPVNKQAELRLVSNDVIHSFWVPEFRVKQDALPGGESFMRKLLITPTQEGEFKVRCAELCGEQHALMESPVIVVSQDAFDAWLTSELGLSADPVERGAKWVNTYGCLTCHSIDGTPGVGPTWLGLSGENVVLTDGTTFMADEEYVRSSILNPNAQIVQGYTPNVMPQNFGQQLTDQQIQDIIAYIFSLK